MTDLLLQPAVHLVEMLSAGSISALELANAHIQQIERLNPLLHALVDFDPDRVRAQARSLDQSHAPRGPLHGLPVTVKASISVAGHLCEVGTVLYRGERPATDAVVVQRLRQAGAVILGTTNCPEFLMAYDTDNLLHGRTSNPWDLTRTAGGSSGGESAAIAAGLSAAGLGSDGGGSVRTPASFTGICALKPTVGRIPSLGHQPPSAGPFALLGVIGPMARTVADLSLLFRVVSGPTPTEPASAPMQYTPVDESTLRSTPIGFFEDDGIVPVAPEIREAVRTAARSLDRQGFRVEPFRPPSLEAVRRIWWQFFVRCGAMLLDPLVRDRPSDLSPGFRGFLDIAHREPPLTGDELLKAWIECDLVRRKLLEEMQQFPILLCPVCSVPAFKHGERSWTIDGHNVAYLDAMRFTQWFNLLGSPAAVLPIARSPQGLPIGVQVCGRPFEDETVLAIAAAIERDFGFHPPPIATQPHPLN